MRIRWHGEQTISQSCGQLLIRVQSQQSLLGFDSRGLGAAVAA
jgi:hypothetical protein